VSAIPVAARPSSPRRAAPRARAIVLWLVGLLPLVVAAIIIVAPVLWTVSTSLRVPAQAFTNPPAWFPATLDWDNYATVFTSVPYMSYVLNSAIVSVGVVVGQLITAGLAGYAFARLRFPGKTLLFWLIMATLMIPLQATIIPVFELISALHLNDTLVSLIVPAWVTPFGVFLLRQYFMGLPHELEEAAVLDGANPWQVFRRVYLPLGLPGFAILAILSFNGTWNDYFRPLIFLTSQQHFTVPLGVVTLFGYLGTGSISVVLAGVVLSIAIVLVVYLFGQRYLLEGLTAGSLKS